MTGIKTLFGIIATTGLIIASPASAGIPASDTRTASVATADLNLATKAGVDHLRGRIRVAALHLCSDNGDLSLERALQIRACYAAAIAGAEPQLRIAVASAEQGRHVGVAIAMNTR